MLTTGTGAETEGSEVAEAARKKSEEVALDDLAS